MYGKLLSRHSSQSNLCLQITSHAFLSVVSSHWQEIDKQLYILKVVWTTGILNWTVAEEMPFTMLIKFRRNSRAQLWGEVIQWVSDSNWNSSWRYSFRATLDQITSHLIFAATELFPSSFHVILEASVYSGKRFPIMVNLTRCVLDLWMIFLFGLSANKLSNVCLM